MSTIFNVLAEDEDSVDPDKIKKVFCSQSVVLMLRCWRAYSCLDTPLDS